MNALNHNLCQKKYGAEGMSKIKLWTRREIIDMWLENDQYLNYKCCPNCRDILKKVGGVYLCQNIRCENDDEYSIKDVEYE